MNRFSSPGFIYIYIYKIPIQNTILKRYAPTKGGLGTGKTDIYWE